MKKFLVVLIIFAFSLSLRLWNLNMMGRTWDEQTFVDWGYTFTRIISKGDFSNSYLYKTSGSPPVTRYLYGPASLLDINKTDSNGNPVFNYDYTYTRLVSVLFACFSVLLVFAIGWKYISPLVGFFSAVILSMLPLSVGYSQTATLESIILFSFTASIFTFLNFLEKMSKRNILLAGIFMGLAFGVKYTNFLLVPLVFLILLTWYLFKGKYEKNYKSYFKATVIIIFEAVVTFFIIWPMALFHINEVFGYNYGLRSSLGTYPSIEVFFGRLMHVPIFYFFIFFLITTPILILIFFFAGAKYISDYGIKLDKFKKYGKTKNLKWIFYTFIIWFCLPFIQSFYNFRHHGVRFIIEIYAPLAIISAIGFDYLAGKIAKKDLHKLFLFLPVAIYLFILLFKITPYYIDYYNIAVGGAKGVYERKTFQLGWWGEGLREAGYYLKDNAKQGSTVGLYISPQHVFPPLDNLKLTRVDPGKQYDPAIKYDYIVVNYFHVLREGFDDSKIKSDYKLIYTVKADGGVLVYVYKNKQKNGML